MGPTLSDSQRQQIETRQRLLNAACEVFGSRVYKEATVREICHVAGANVAAVNYHFGGKEKLYDAAWRYAFALTDEKYPIRYEAQLAPEQQLRSIVQAFLGRILDSGPAGYFPRLMIREMTQPTALATIVDEVIRPSIEVIKKIVRNVADRELTDAEAHFCTVSVVSQCVFFNFSRPMRQHMMGRSHMEAHELGQLVEHVTSFSIAGIRRKRSDRQEQTDDYL